MSLLTISLAIPPLHLLLQVLSGPSTGGKLQVGYQQALLASLPGGVSGLAGTKDKIKAFLSEDPREALLRRETASPSQKGGGVEW